MPELRFVVRYRNRLGTRTGIGIQWSCCIRNKNGAGDKIGYMYRQQRHCGSCDPLSGAVKTGRVLNNQSILTGTYLSVNGVGKIEHKVLRQPKKQLKV